jgi:hypothetical protein
MKIERKLEINTLYEVLLLEINERVTNIGEYQKLDKMT